MDEQGFKAWLLPLVTQLLSVLGRYIVPALCTYVGLEEAKASSWWTATAAILAGVVVGAVSSFLKTKKVLDKAADQTDAKIAENDKL